MKTTLDYSQEEFKSLLDKSSQLILQQFEHIDDIKGFQYHEPAEVAAWFDEEIPQEPMPIDELLKEVEHKVLATKTGNLGPHMYGYVVSGGNQVSIVADSFAATINQNVAKWHLAPAITEIDKRIIQWAGQLVGFTDKAAGFIGSSGSSANLDGLTVARNIFFAQQNIKENGLFGIPPFTIYCSTETHSSIDKSVHLLGIGTKHLRKIATNSDLTIDTNALAEQIAKDKAAGFTPFCIVGNAGTVNTGVIDDLSTLAQIAKEHGLWFHVDGAYGGLAASLDSVKHLYQGIHLADSVALDFHKWLYQPFEIGCLLVKNWDLLQQSYFKAASYLDKSLEKSNGRLEFNEHHFLLSRSAKSLKAWMSIKAFGMRQIQAMMQKDIDLALYLSRQVAAANDFELCASSPLAISCFRYKGQLKDQAAINEVNKQLIPALEKDGRVFITSTKLNDNLVLRACLINHRKTKASTDYLLEVIREIGEKLALQLL